MKRCAIFFHKGLCTKDVHPKGGRGGFEIVDENGHGGGGVLTEWMSTFPDFSKYNCEQNLKHLKNQSGAVTINGQVDTGQSCVTSNLILFSS